MTTRLAGLLFTLVLASGAPFAADVIQSEPASLSVPAAGDDLKNCEFITNDCEVCTVAEGRASCSSQGIACTPTRRWCLISKK